MDHLPYQLIISLKTAATLQVLEKHLADYTFGFTDRGELIEGSRFDQFRIISSGDLSPRISVEVDNSDLVGHLNMTLPMGVTLKDMKLSFAFLAQLNEYNAEIIDQEIQNQHFLAHLERNPVHNNLLVINEEIKSKHTHIPPDFEHFKLNIPNIKRRTLLLSLCNQ